MNDRLQALADAGVSIWLDDLSRERIETGNLASLVADSGVVGDAGRIVSLEHYGASADYATLYDKFGITAEAVAAAAKDSIAAAAGEPSAPFHARPAGAVGPADNADAQAH